MKIIYCCKKMDDEMKASSIYFSPTSKKLALNALIDRVTGHAHIALNYCLFCGKKITIV